MTLLKLRLPLALLCGAAILMAASARGADDSKPAANAAPAATAGNLLPDDARKAWDEVVESARPPKPPPEWNQKAPNDEQRAAFRLTMGQAAAVAADKAKEFIRRFPSHEKVDDARDLQHQMLLAAVQLGVKDREKELKNLASAAGAEDRPAAPAKPAVADDRPHVLADDEAKAWEQIEADRKALGLRAAEFADKAREFYVRFPNHEKADGARDHQRQSLMLAVQLGLRERIKELQELAPGEDVDPADPADPAQAEFVKKFNAVVSRAQGFEEKGMEAMLTEFEKGLRELQKDYPDRPEIYDGLLQVAQGVGGEKSTAILKEVADSKAPESLRKMAASLLKTQERVGKPLDVKFKALDGREVDLAAMKGKVVLVDFWATWCGPCIAELPRVLAAYEKLQPKGFEIVGISFDEEKEDLEQFVKRKKMPWPQYFDGEGWGNKYGKEYGITGIPAMWLVDKKGNLRDLNAREDLAGKVEKLLGEN